MFVPSSKHSRISTPATCMYNTEQNRLRVNDSLWITQQLPAEQMQLAKKRRRITIITHPSIISFPKP